MLGKLSELVTPSEFLVVLLAIILIGYFIYKEWPEFKKRVSRRSIQEMKQETTDLSIEQRLAALEEKQKEDEEKLARDYARLNQLEKQHDHFRKQQKELMEEMELIMRALLGILQGLQEQGINGPTAKASKDILDYLNKKAHDNDLIDEQEVDLK